jgi:hypothetical protein
MRRSLHRSFVREAMPARLRPRLEPTDDWQQVQLLLNLVVLFPHPFAECHLPGGEPWITNEVTQ